VGDDRAGLLVERDRLDHRRPVDTEYATPYVGIEHCRSPHLVFEPSNSPKT
jgi:hypothetical protein